MLPAIDPSDPRVRVLLDDVARWPGTVLNSHRSANQTFHTLEFLSELGLPPETPEIAAALDRILESMGDDGVPRLPMADPDKFGASGGRPTFWALCDAPTVLLCLVRFGRGADPRVRAGVAALSALCRPNGWPCAVSPELGSYRGPGRKGDPCPYATLIMLRLLAEVGLASPDAGSPGAGRLCVGAPGSPDAGAPGAGSPGALPPGAESPEAAAGVECLLSLWAESRVSHPYMFFMGDDFRKLKAPFFWYDILHVADVLSRFPAARRDERFRDMMRVVRSKRLPDGGFLAESVYQPYRDWDFGQKREPSPWIRFLAERIENRL